MRVPRADLLADVAAEEPHPDFRSELARNRATIFDRQIGNALARLHHIAIFERVRRAQIQALAASTAMLSIGSVRAIEFDVSKNFGEKKIGAALARQQHG